MFNNKKKVNFSQIQSLSKQYKKEKKSIVFTNGCFDIIHAGHVKYLNYAASLGDILILGLNSDNSVRSIKGENRPIISQDDRAVVVSALSCIDHVVIFDEPDPLNLIKTVVPDILVKGADWSEDQIIGGDFVKENGGKIHRADLEPNISTSTIIKQIGKLYYGKK